MTLAEAVAAAFATPGALLEHGAVVRLYADLRDVQDDPYRPRWRRSADVPLTPEAVDRIVNSLGGHSAEELEDAFVEEFSESYGFAADVGLVRSLEVWPEGSAPPA
jgi:hypothetical protein